MRANQILVIWLWTVLAGAGCGTSSSSGDAGGDDGGAATADLAAQAGDGGERPDLASGGVIPPGTDRDIVAFAGGAATARWNAILALSDGTFLVGGGAANLDWLPPGTPVVEIPAAGITSSSTGQVAFLAQLAPDLSKILRVARFPKDTVRDVTRIRASSLPGRPTGDLFISGGRDGAGDGYYIAKLDGNFVNRAPAGLAWAYNAKAPEGSSYKALQPWDVGGDGKVVCAEGLEFDYNWAQIQRLGTNGAPEPVEHWTAHWTNSTEWDGTPASSHPNNGNDPIVRSAIVMKAGRKGSLRSATQADFDLAQADENGNPGRKGRYPDDYYFSGPCPLDAMSCPGGPGYTGYKTSGRPTQRVGAIVVDRRNGDLYFGYSTQSVLPGGNPDFEPAVVAMDAAGRLKWWDRLYRETKDNSTPDQYVDRLAIDYASDTLLVLARCHGNNTINYWSGDKLAAAPGEKAFQNQFTGTQGNIHISWLGRLGLGDGKIRRATWVAEYVDGMKGAGAPHADPNLDGWADPNAGWADLNTTRASALEVDEKGNVYLAAVGRRTITTRGAYQKMLKPADGTSVWNHFIRVYTPDLKTLVYSTLLVGRWDPVTGAGAGDGDYTGIAPVANGVAVVGYFVPDAKVPDSSIPTVNVPAWGTASPGGTTAAVLAHLLFK